MNGENSETSEAKSGDGSSRNPTARALGLVAHAIDLTAKDVDQGDKSAGSWVKEGREEGKDLGRGELL